VQVKIGVLRSAREIVFESDQTPEDVESAVTASTGSGEPLRLIDSKGTTVLIPAANIAYVEIGAARKGGVGFGSL
jgi:Protein of unknown function (DUF3107)